MTSNSPAHSAERFPLIVFVHVPKTGGSTVNRMLWLCSHRGHSHCESIPQPLLDLALHNDWLSGHITRDGFAGALIWLGRPVEYFSVVREPVSQILSALNWHFEIFHRGPESFYALAHEMKLLAAEVRATDFSKPSSIIALLLRHAHVFLDCQARYILGGDFASISESEVARKVATYSYIATSQNLSALYPAFGFAALPGGANELWENPAQKYHFDTTQFQSQEITDFLAHHNQNDLRLYTCVQKTFRSAEGRCPFRPAFPIATAESYEEQAYLDANPDVVEALKFSPDWLCAYNHFDLYGLPEQRRQLVSPADPGDRVSKPASTRSASGQSTNADSSSRLGCRPAFAPK
jgi:hypothetical protein